MKKILKKVFTSYFFCDRIKTKSRKTSQSLRKGENEMKRTTRKVLAIATKGYKTKNLYNWEQVRVYQNRGWRIEMA